MPTKPYPDRGRMAQLIPFFLGAVVASAAWGGFIMVLHDFGPMPTCPRGFVVVPEKPTRKMLAAAAKAMSPGKRPTMRWVSVRKKHEIRYRAMIAAAKE